MQAMPLGTSILLIAVGAILKFAVTERVSGIELETVGLILLLVGILGLVISLILMQRSDRGEAVVTRDRVVERERDPRL